MTRCYLTNSAFISGRLADARTSLAVARMPTRHRGSTMSDDQNDNRLDLTRMDRNRGGPGRRNSRGRCRRGSRLRLEKRKSPQGLQRRLPTPRRSAEQGYCRRRDHPLSRHYACFDLATGEATAAPAFDALLEYAVTLDDDRFSVKPAHATTPRRTGRREDSRNDGDRGRRPAGFAAADAIRKLGWRGGRRTFSDEAEQPYGRTFLTKDYLEGAFGNDRLPIAYISC